MQVYLNKEDLIRHGRYALTDPEINYMYILVKAYDNKPELIINSKESCNAKLEYYTYAYDYNLVLMSNNNIRVIDFGFVKSLGDAVDSLMGYKYEQE